MKATILPRPTWMRLGLTSPPDPATSGQGVGLVVLDRIRPHATLRHLGRHVKHVVVHDDLTVTCRDVALERPDESMGSAGEHGLMAALLLAHAPFTLDGHKYVGLAPAADHIVLDHGRYRQGEAERLKRGMARILERRDEWNPRIVLETGWNVGEPGGWIENTGRKPCVRGLRAALEAGLLVVAANGNTRLESELPPVEHLAVGGFDDAPLSPTGAGRPYPDEPWGRNGDGHVRPDVLAPRLHLPVPYCETNEPPADLSYFGGTSGASALVAGVCAHILSHYPDLSADVLRQILVDTGDPIAGYENPAPRVSAARAVEAVAAGYEPQLPFRPPPIRVTQPDVSVRSADPVERGLALTMLAKQGKCSRAQLWQYASDESPIVRKVAVWALQKPRSSQERKSYWGRLGTEAEGGVRGWWAYGLLHESTKEELGLWLRWASDANWSVRWCVSEFLSKHPELPKLEMTTDPDLMAGKASPILAWYEQHRGSWGG